LSGAERPQAEMRPRRDGKPWRQPGPYWLGAGRSDVRRWRRCQTLRQ